jgi:hypothetical protein
VTTDATPGALNPFSGALFNCGPQLPRRRTRSDGERIAADELATRWKRPAVDKHGWHRVEISIVAGYSTVPLRAVR